MVLEDAIQRAAIQLEEVTTVPWLEAEVLLAFIIGKDRAFVMTHGDTLLTLMEEQQYNNLISRRRTGMPIAYLTQKKEFYGRDFYIDDRALIPRPETEGIIDIIRDRFIQRPQARVLDLCTGSGCIAVTVKKEFPNATVIGTDIDDQALTVASINTEELNADVQLYHGDLFEALPAKSTAFDIIVSNPPYVDSHSVDLQSKESMGLQFEPQHALIPEGDPLSIIERIIQQARGYLKEDGILIIEFGHGQAAQIHAFVEIHMNGYQSEVVQDLAGLDRFMVIQKRTDG